MCVDCIYLAQDGADGGLCEHGNKHAAYVMCWQFLGHPSDCRLLRKSSVVTEERRFGFPENAKLVSHLNTVTSLIMIRDRDIGKARVHSVVTECGGWQLGCERRTFITLPLFPLYTFAFVVRLFVTVLEFASC
jgi:hypothetical protein